MTQDESLLTRIMGGVNSSDRCVECKYLNDCAWLKESKVCTGKQIEIAQNILAKAKKQQANPDREKIRTITHAGCTYHTEPICPINGNHACIYCEQMTDQIVALFPDEEDELRVVGLIRKQERERILNEDTIADVIEGDGNHTPRGSMLLARGIIQALQEKE